MNGETTRDSAKENKPTLATQLAAQLRQAIRDGEYVAGQAIPSERELSESTQLSRTTVRRAVELLVDEGLLQRVAGSGTYVSRRRTAGAIQDTITLIVPSFTNPYYGELAYSIEHEANAHGYQLLVGQSYFDSGREGDYLLRNAENPAVKGVMVVPCGYEAPMDTYGAVAQDTPLVFVSRVPEEQTIADSVVCDRVMGAFLLVKHMIGLGHGRIAYVRGIPPRMDLHLIGYQRALQHAGIPVDQELVVSVEAGPEEAGALGTRQLLRQGIHFTAVFARNDLTAIGIMRELADAGLRVPQDVSLGGFDNTEASSHLQPPLTTVDNSVREQGRLAVLFLLDRIEGRYAGPPRQVAIQPKLIYRSSIAAPRSGEIEAPAPVSSERLQR